MTAQEIIQRLTAAQIPAQLQETPPEPFLEIPREALPAAAELLKSDADLAFDNLLCLSALERPENLETVYHLFSFRHRRRITLKTRCPKDDPVIPSVAAVWRTAEWHEREAYDLVGIRFSGHPDLRRILLPEDWEGHPLRKDYQPPAAYHGIPLSVETPPTTDDGK
jgi:NADH-quinone oxidoreductase subunit C